VPSMILGTLGVLLLYLVARRLGASRALAFFAAFILSFESLSYIHGRIATLDIYFATFILLGTWLYLSLRYELAGVAFGVAALCKVNGMFGLFAVILYDVLVAVQGAWKGSVRASLPGLRPTWAGVRPALLVTVFAAGFFLVGLGALDNYYTEFTGPFAHLSHMLHYHVGLTHVRGATSGAQSTPLDWWVNEGQINYYTWTDGKDDHVWYRGAMNEYVIWAAPFALLYAGKRAWTDGSKLALFAVASFVCNFGPPLAAWILASRTSYIYYMVPSIPAFALAIAAAAEKLPRPAWWAFAGAMLYSFAYSFPVHPLTVHSP
jgi:predicted membrane-bound dolichyl-phosphate-mannose-protein mannosyltransferase